MTRKLFLKLFFKYVKKYKYRVYRKYPNVHKSDMKYGRALFAWCYIKDISRGIMLTPIMIVYMHRYYRRRKRKGLKVKVLSYFQERRAAYKIGLSEYNYVVICAAAEKDYRDLSPKQERLAVELRKKMLEVCIVMGKGQKEKENEDHGKGKSKEVIKGRRDRGTRKASRRRRNRSK